MVVLSKLYIKGAISMRRILVATLVAIPALVSSQASTAQPSHVPAMLLAKIAAPTLPSVLHGTPVNLVIHQAVDVDVNTVRSIAVGPTVQSANEASAPKLISAVKTELTPQQIAAGSKADIRVTVDRNGVPQDLVVLSATNSDVAKRTLAAVSQYRFQPATMNFTPIAATITLSINVR